MKTNLKKKLCAAALSALMLTGAGVFQAVPVMFGGMPVYAQTAETPESSFSYTINNSREVFIMNYKGTDANVVVPAKIQNKPVTSICSGSFKFCRILSRTLKVLPSKAVRTFRQYQWPTA